MPIVVKLDDLLHERRMTLTELADRLGMTLANLSILKTGKARAVRFSTLDAICAALQCQPGDLLEYAVPPVAHGAPTTGAARKGLKGQLKMAEADKT
jgi:putative transcriptional regulator